MPEYGINGTTLNLEHLVFKGANAAAWDANYVLAAGELGIELDTKKVKLGDGTKKWSELDYYSDPQVTGVVDALTTRVSTAEGTLSSLGSRVDAIDGADGEIAGLKAKDTAHEGRLDALDGENGEIAGLKAKDTAHETRMTSIESKGSAQDSRLSALEAITTISANPFRS